MGQLKPLFINTEYEQGAIPSSIANMDMKSVKLKLIERAKSGREASCPPVPLDRLDQAIEDYKKYLFLNLKYQGVAVAPSYDIDEVWHQHILFTKKYAEDCNRIFGEMRHHIPHFGRSEPNHPEDIRVLDSTRRLFQSEFGSVPASYEGMTATTSDNGWSGNVDLSKVGAHYWDTISVILTAPL